MKVKVLIPFHLSAKNHDCVPGEEIDVTAEQLAKIRAINVNMVEVVEVEEPAEDEEPTEEVEAEEPAEETKKKPKKKAKKEN